MNEDALREMVRAAVARRLATPTAVGQDNVQLRIATDMSHQRYALPDSGGACLIEPAVTCNHCGYCQSHGH
jgi:predicted Zn-ribbon and HTH transcriptional regulator